MIPKIIHYCWFGGGKKSKQIDECIKSWKRFFPEYYIIEWNEDNFDINSISYTKEAYKKKKWAFVSDYVRMKVLYEHGGIYFDTDVKVLKEFPRELLELNSFTGIESCSRLVNPGLIYACKKGDDFVKKILDTYTEDTFKNESVSKIKTINIRVTDILEEMGYVKEDKTQIIGDLKIFSSDFFCAYDDERRCASIKDNTLSTHLYSHSWFPWWRSVIYELGTIKRRIIYSIKHL